MSVTALPAGHAAHATPVRPHAVMDRARIERAATDFTATALNELLAPLFEALPQDGGPFGGGAGEAAWRPMLVQEVAAAMARNGGLGITTLVSQAMLRLQETTP